MTEQMEYCSRCHGSGRVGYVREDGRRGHTRCPDCQIHAVSRKAYVDGTLRNQRTLPLSEVPQAVRDALRDTGLHPTYSTTYRREAAGEVKRLLQPPTTPEPPPNAPVLSNAQQTASQPVGQDLQWTPEDEQMFSEAWEAWTWE